MAPTPCRVLLVEDDRPTMVMLSTLLRSRGYVVDEAVNGGEALRRIAEHCPQVVVSDLCMPGMNGLELLRKIHTRAVKDECSIFFILITGQTSTGAVEAIEAITEGAADCLVKPFDTDQLIAILESHDFRGIK